MGRGLLGLVGLLLLALLCRGAEAGTGQFWHLTDIHLDLNYTVSSFPN